MADLLQVTTTLPSQEQAAALARALVEQRLAACGQVVGPITSVYWWRGEVTSDQEWMVILKSTAGPTRLAAASSAAAPSPCSTRSAASTTRPGSVSST